MLKEISLKFNFDIAVLLQITNPFITAKIIDKALTMFIKDDYDSMLSAVPMRSFIWEKKKIQQFLKIIKLINDQGHRILMITIWRMVHFIFIKKIVF